MEQKSQENEPGRAAAQGHGRPTSADALQGGKASGGVYPWGTSGRRNGPEPSQAMRANELPEHIEVRIAADGRTYYVNHQTHKTSWNYPPPQDW